MRCPYCGSTDLREKMNSFVCNSCGKNFDRPKGIKTIAALVFLLCFSGCAATLKEQRRSSTLDCTKDLIGYEASPTEAYKICRDLYSPSVYRRTEGSEK
jgi:hypothetical protein